MLLGRGNHEADGAWDLGTADLVAVSRYEAGVSLPINMVRNAIRSVPRDDARRMPVVDDGGNGSFRLQMGIPPGTPADSALSSATTPLAACLNVCESRDRVPRALLRSSSREIVAPGAASRRASS